MNRAGNAYRVAVGQTVNQHRTSRGWSLRTLADRSGLSVPYLSELENALKEPSGETLEHLSQAFEMSLAELLVAIALTLDQAAQASQVALLPKLDDLQPWELAEIDRFAAWLRWRRQH